MKGPEALYYNMPHSTKIFILQSQLLYGFYFLKKKKQRENVTGIRRWLVEFELDTCQKQS
jgi:hypothetical protein